MSHARSTFSIRSSALLIVALAGVTSAGCVGSVRTGSSGLDLPSRPARFDIEQRSPESAAPRAEAERLVQTTLREGRWDKKSAQRLRQLLPQLSPESQIAIVQPLLQAANSGKLKLAYAGPLF